MGACASIGHNLYMFGSYDRSHHQNCLYKLDTSVKEWTKLADDGPMQKVGCEMIAYDNKLVDMGFLMASFRKRESFYWTASTQMVEDGLVNCVS